MRQSTKISRRFTKGVFLVLTVYAVIYVPPNKVFMLIALSTTLLLTILLRTVFCGWVCPLGTIFDLTRRLGRWIGRVSVVKPANRKYKKWVKNNRVILDKTDYYLRSFKYFFLLWILQAAFLGIASIKDGDERGIVSVLYLLIALLVLGLFVERAWCRYSCPVGAVIGLFGKLSPARITRRPDTCIDCNICSRTCPMNIDVANREYVRDIDCNTCVKCIEACPVDDALELKFKIPRFRKKIIL